MKETSGFKAKIALVVGGASGMGNAVVRLLARELGQDEAWQIEQLKDFGRVAACFDVSKQP
jgi:NADP-dependent 3-hydroxy acid dehydrogenase YdfG